MTKTPDYLVPDIDDFITHTSKYMEMEKFVTVTAELACRLITYEYEGCGYYDGEGDWIDPDAFIHEAVESDKYQAILAFFEVTEEELEAWKEENVEVAHWVAQSAGTGGCEFPELDEFILNYKEEG